MVLPLLFVLAVAILGTDGRFFRNDYTYYPEAQGWMKLHRMPAKWHDARLRCYSEGSVLASPMTNDLMYGMRSVIGQSPLFLFTGIADAYESGEFRSIEGLPLIKTAATWAPMEPDNREAREHCIAMYSNTTIADVDCDSPLPYICYKKKTKKIPGSDHCGTVDPDYVYEARTQHCYKFHRNGQPWQTAYMICSAEGGYLTIINSDVEAQVLRELINKNPAKDIFAKHKDIIAAGFHDWSHHGIWMTVQGQPLIDTGYHRWAGGQPDNATTGEYCGSVFRSAELNDIWCHDALPFICEKEPGSLMENDTGSEEKED